MLVVVLSLRIWAEVLPLGDLSLCRYGASGLQVHAATRLEASSVQKESSPRYHNWNHAVDTMHSVYVILQSCRELFSGIEVRLGVLTACLQL